jgi:PAS domain S-box-containing protein
MVEVLHTGQVEGAVHHHRSPERRRPGHPPHSPMTALKQLPALVALERLPDPVVAVAENGIMLFANGAFAEMLGYTTPDAVLSLNFHQIFHTPPAAESAVWVVCAHAEMVVELAHRAGWIVRTKMSKSALLRRDDPVALVMFQDLTKQLWDASNR